MSDDSSKKISHINAVLRRQCGESFEEIVEWQRELRSAVQDLIIDRIEPAFNQKLATFPHETFAEKKKLCRWANSELHALGLSAKCPKTGQPSILHADPGHHPLEGRFQLQVVGGDNRRKRTTTSQELFEINLTAAPMRVEPIKDYWEKRLNSPPPGTRRR